jgi:hypothetical protein
VGLGRGRQSAAELAIVPQLPHRLAEPPSDLNEAQAQVWRDVIAAKPVDWFGKDSLPLLSAYCKAVTEHARISSVLDSFDTRCLVESEHLNTYDRLTKLQDRHARLMTTLATKMRLTQQSKYRADAAAVADKKPTRPWLTEG